jgi:hypothetical protein
LKKKKKWQSVVISTKRHYSHIGRLHKKAQSLIRHSALGSPGPRVLGSGSETSLTPRSWVSSSRLPGSRFRFGKPVAPLLGPGPRVLGSVRKTCMIPRSGVSAPPDSRFLSENRSVLSARAQSSKSSTGWISLYLLISSAYI